MRHRNNIELPKTLIDSLLEKAKEQHKSPSKILSEAIDSVYVEESAFEIGHINLSWGDEQESRLKEYRKASSVKRGGLPFAGSNHRVIQLILQEYLGV